MLLLLSSALLLKHIQKARLELELVEVKVVARASKLAIYGASILSSLEHLNEEENLKE